MIFLKTLAHTLLIPGPVLALVPYLIALRGDPRFFELNTWSLVGSLLVLNGILIGSWAAPSD